MLRFPPKKILVPFDFSDISLSAWEQAQILARRFDSAVEAVYVEEPIPIYEGGGHYYQKDREQLRKETLEHIRSKIGGSADVSFMEGDPARIIQKLARSRRPDLIIMGTHGRSGFERVLLGSVTESVVRLSPVPVFTVRREIKPIKSILAPVNFTPYAEHGLAFAAGVAAALKAPLTVLHVGISPENCQNPKFRLNRMIARLPESIRGRCAPTLIVRYGAATENILRVGREHDLIVLSAHRKSLLEDIVLGTTAERVIRHSRVPILTIPPIKTSFNWSRWLRSYAEQKVSPPLF